eukprot:366360-Chlamydomonas_euryale.AAC.9
MPLVEYIRLVACVEDEHRGALSQWRWPLLSSRPDCHRGSPFTASLSVWVPEDQWLRTFWSARVRRGHARQTRRLHASPYYAACVSLLRCMRLLTALHASSMPSKDAPCSALAGYAPTQAVSPPTATTTSSKDARAGAYAQ